MRVLVLILQSIRASSNHGGSSKVVKQVCGDLVAHGHQVTLLCGAATDNNQPFQSNGVDVRPELPFRQSWQDTWLVPPVDLSRILSTVVSHAAGADRIVIFDSHLPYPDLLPSRVPVIWSLRDFVYVQALQGSMAFRRDLMITPSDYLRNAFCDTAQAWLPGVGDRLQTIRNGVDRYVYRPSDAARIRRRLGLSGGPAMLFPHRPEDAKGFSSALELCRRLIADAFPELKLVILRGTDVSIMPEVRAFYTRAEEMVRRLGITSNVVFSDWLTPEDMPEMYSAVDVTLCLGDIVEACSNSALESLACGTPVIASNIACYREFPDAVRKIPVGDLDAAVAAVLEVLNGPSHRVVTADLRDYDHQSMLDAFRTTIETAEVKPALTPIPPRGGAAKVPVWISEQRGLLYDEYRKRVVPDQGLRAIWIEHGHEVFTVPPGGDVHRLIRAGHLVHVT